nr:hypothetical protein [Mycoplasmopsis bovis]
MKLQWLIIIIFSRFISAIGEAKRVVFVGGVEQLHQVLELAMHLKILLNLKIITTVELKSTHRQKVQSKITDFIKFTPKNL